MRRNGASKARRPVLVICGGGNAGHALCVIASQNFSGDVLWLVGSEEKAHALRQGVFSRDGLRATGVISGRADRVRIISSQASDVIPQADVVLIAAPAFVHAQILQNIAPFLRDDVLLGSLPTRGGFEFEVCRYVGGIYPNGGRRIFGLQTLPWSTRVQELGKVTNFGSVKAKVLMAAQPSTETPRLASQLSRLFGTRILPTPNFLNMTLGNPGQVIHPGLMYGHFARWSGQTFDSQNIPLFYAHASDEIGAFVETLSRDILNIARKIESTSRATLDLSGVVSIHDWLRGAYPTQTEDFSSVAKCFRTGPLQARRAPVREIAPDTFVPDFDYRYLREDVPYGLVIARAIGQLAAVPTPAIDQLLYWAQERLAKRYLERPGVCGVDAAALPLPQNAGINSIGELIAWYLPVDTRRAQSLSV